VVASQANRAAGDVWWPTIMHFFSYGAVMMPLGWVLAHDEGLGIGVDGLVWAVIIASLVSASLLTGRFVRIARRLGAGIRD
jgi:MATE family multidrug resistance protein